MEKILCGVDIGGTKLSVALVRSDGSIIDKCIDCDHVHKTECGMTDQVKANIERLLVKNGLSENDLQGIGIGCAGHIRYHDGIIITTSNLRGYKCYPLRNAIQSHFRVPVLLDNDANAQAFGEFRFGAGRGFDDMVFLTISTGIGAGIIINRKLYRGMTGTAGEFGHTIVEPGSDMTCTCGNRGCLMAVACGLALPHLYRKKIESGMIPVISPRDGSGYHEVDGKFIKRGLEEDDEICTSIVLETGRYIGIALYNIFQALNPPLIVLGGGLMSWGELYLSRIRSTFYEYARDMMHNPVEIKVSEIGPDAGVIGAASLITESC